MVFIRAALRKAPQRPVEMPIDNSSSIAVWPMPAALSRCSSCKGAQQHGHHADDVQRADAKGDDGERRPEGQRRSDHLVHSARLEAEHPAPFRPR